jgi:hypothetical protein
MLNYIPNDGYTEDAYIEALPGFYGEFRFKFRPMLIEERAALFNQNDKLPPAEYERKCAAALSNKLVEWSLIDKAGKQVPVSAQNILRLKPNLNGRIFGIVLGTQATDIDPLWSESKKESSAEQKYESAITGASVQESDVKN